VTDSIQSILETHAEVAMALGGFASVAAALGRPLAPVRRQRFLALLFLALALVLQSLLPIWLAQLGLSSSGLWRVSSLLSFGIATTVIVSTVVLPLRKTGYTSGMLKNPSARHFVNLGGGISVVLLPLNAIGLPASPGFGIYYASLALAFATGFVLFADAVLLADDK
jgi:hypothetical protein